MEKKKDLFIIYSNYLHALVERREYGDKYGDTEELIEAYEKQLEKVLVKKQEKNKDKS